MRECEIVKTIWSDLFLYHQISPILYAALISLINQIINLKLCSSATPFKSKEGITAHQ